QAYSIHRKELRILLNERVLRPQQYLFEIRHGKLIQHRNNRQASDEFRHHPETDQILGRERLHHLLGLHRLILLSADRRKPETALAESTLHEALKTDERTTTDEQDVRRVDLHVLLIRVLATALRRN